MQSKDIPDNRLELRNNIFVMAALYAVGRSMPVRVRNMSRGGALIEAAALPPVDTPVRLSRGSLSVSGQIMWVSERKAGLQFAGPVAVTEWLPNTKRGSGQQLIDELVHLTRLGTVTKSAGAPLLSDGNLALSDELDRLARLIERAGEQLASDSAVAARHLVALQMIDGAAQALAKLASESTTPPLILSATTASG